MKGSFAWTDMQRIEGEEFGEARTARERFAQMDIFGTKEWQALIVAVEGDLRARGHSEGRGRWDSEPRSGAPAQALLILEELRSLRHLRDPKPDGPRLFISHRRSDVEPARRIAWLAMQCGYSYWLDVEDPLLIELGSAGQPGDPVHSILVAAIIEIALLNSTHVIAVLTPNSFPPPVADEPAHAGPSLWIPYEFARAKARSITSKQAASWLSKEVVMQTLPEYLYLGHRFSNENEVRHWLASQLHLYAGAPGGGSQDPVIANTTPLN